MCEKNFKERQKKFIMTAIEQMLCVFCIVLSLILTFYYAGLLADYIAILMVLLWVLYTIAVVKYARVCYIYKRNVSKSELKVFTYNKYLTAVSIVILAYVSCKTKGYIGDDIDNLVLFLLMYAIGHGMSRCLIFFSERKTK